jgi:hypothetical protein
LWVDCVAKLFFGVCAIFSRGAGAFARKICGGSHEQSDFQPAAFVSSLQGIVSPKIHFDGQIAKFSRTLIFEFCNKIGQERLFALQKQRAFSPITRSGNAIQLQSSRFMWVQVGETRQRDRPTVGATTAAPAKQTAGDLRLDA